MKLPRFMWIDLPTPDLEAAKKFYGGLFDWSFIPAPGGHNALAKKDDKAVAALVQLANPKARWNLYVGVESADETANKAKALGAELLEPPFNVLDLGRIAALRDPTGAPFALWQSM